MRPHPKRTSTNTRSPRAWATCDRSGFITNHEKLVYQFDWRGTRLENLRVLVAPDMLDKPQRQLGTIILPPDPVAILNARPEQYTYEEITFRVTETGQQRYQLDGTPRVESNLQLAEPVIPPPS
ncbi:MAG: hypothetical protein WCD69_25440 [Xanthobacteraceae bacterium]